MRKTNYTFEVPCTLTYEVEAYTEEDARRILSRDAGVSITGIRHVDRDKYETAELIHKEELTPNYPFEDGDTYYTIEKTGAGYEPCESTWDSVSEEMHDEDPDTPYFINKGNAWKGVRLVNNIEAHDKTYARSDDFIAYERGRQQYNAIRLLAEELGEPGRKIMDKLL